MAMFRRNLVALAVEEFQKHTLLMSSRWRRRGYHPTGYSTVPTVQWFDWRQFMADFLISVSQQCNQPRLQKPRQSCS